MPWHLAMVVRVPAKRPKQREVAKRRGSGDGSIYRLKSGRWQAVITVASGGGKQVRRKRSARTYNEARTRLKELQDERDAGLIGTRQSLAKYLEDWQANILPTRELSVATIENYGTMVDLHIVPVLGHLRLDLLRAEHIDGLLRNMAKEGKAKSTIRLARTVLGIALTHAERRGLVLKNEARLSVIPADAPVRASRSLTIEQAQKLLECARGTRLEAAWVTGLQLGLRPGEVFALRWDDDIDFAARTLTVNQAIRRAGGDRFELGDPKTKRSKRTLGMPADVMDGLQRHRVRQIEERMAVGPEWVETGLVFTTPSGKMINPSTSRSAFSRLTTAAGLGHWRPHELRHSMVSLLSAAEVPLEQIGDVAGHAPGSKITGAVYRHQIKPSADASAQGDGRPLHASIKRGLASSLAPYASCPGSVRSAPVS